MNSPGYLSVFAVVILFVSGMASNVVAKSPKPARIMKTKAQLSEFQTALEIYRLDNGEYPGVAQGLQALVERPVGTHAALNWREGGYLGRLPKDPWGREYHYRNPGIVDPVEVYSFGRDGKPGGCGEDADLYSSAYESVDHEKCKSEALRQRIVFWVLVVVALATFALILAYFLNRLYKSVGGNLPEFYSKLIVWIIGFIGLIMLLSLFMPRIY